MAAVLGFVGVAMGAFGAHALAERVTASRLETFRTGALYQMLHVPVVLALGLANRWLGVGWLMVAGVLVFSGSLYLLVLLDQPRLGAITPMGGVLLLVAWLWLAVSAVRGQASESK